MLIHREAQAMPLEGKNRISRLQHMLRPKCVEGEAGEVLRTRRTQGVIAARDQHPPIPWYDLSQVDDSNQTLRINGRQRVCRTPYVQFQHHVVPKPLGQLTLRSLQSL